MRALHLVPRTWSISKQIVRNCAFRAAALATVRPGQRVGS